MNFRDLHVWQMGIELVDGVYKLVDQLPRTEQFGLADQIRRAGVSVPANIAEGRSRATTREFLRSLGIACGSLAEVETYLVIIARRKYLPEASLKELQSLIDVLSRKLNALRRSLRRKLQTPKP